jgi:hypothetical protein
VFSPESYPEFLPIVKRDVFRYFLRFVDHAEEILKALVAQRLKALNTNAYAVEVAAGLPEDTVRAILRGQKKSGTTLNKARAVCEALDLEFYIGPKREVAKPTPLRVISNLDPEYDAPTGFVVIPWHDARPGDGSAPVAFSRAWLSKNKLVPDFLQAIRPDRISVPGPRPSDTVALLDTRTADRKGADLWCYRDAGKTAVGRITFKGSLAAIHPVERDGEVRILESASAFALGLIGRVVWLGQMVPVTGSIG